jgi:hypothetical protein
MRVGVSVQRVIKKVQILDEAAPAEPELIYFKTAVFPSMRPQEAATWHGNYLGTVIPELL